MVKLIKGKNDLATTNPNLAHEWHPSKNGELSPTDVFAGSGQKVWWLYPYDDPNTGKHFDFEWQATISSRNKGVGCPFLSGGKVWLGFNDLKTINPALAAEWHPYKNGELKPEDVTAGSKAKVWWLYPYDDPN
ncbi:MAG: zinc-ribbon domain-containing protein, partial [Firmicutes bacterium]|nr:zinc-ribbon domain-containing protein [Bacillota bacterium]